MRIRTHALIAVLFSAVSLIAYAQSQPATNPPRMTIKNVTGGLYEIEGGGGNVVLYVTPDGAVLVDDKFPGDASYKALMGTIKQVTNQPIKYVFNTHYHEDHTGTNRKFSGTADVISTLNSRRNTLGPAWQQAYGEHRVPPITPVARSEPAQIVFTEETSVFLGGKEVRARYFGRGHTNGDAFIYFPDEKAIHTGDTVTRIGDTWGPMVDYDGGGSIVELTRTLHAVADQWDFDTVIPGHGPILNKAGMREYIKGIEAFRSHALSLVKQGKTRDEFFQILSTENKWAPNNLNVQWTMPGLWTELNAVK